MISSNLTQPQKEQRVVIRSFTNQNHYLFISNDQHRAYGEDFDVRTHAHKEQRNELILVHEKGNVYSLRSTTNQNHYIFVSNDQHRKFGEDFDVRTHAHVEDRNRFIVERVKGDIYTFRSFTNPNHYLFAANDGSNAYGEDFDVRTHAHKEERNKWVIEGFHYHLLNQTVTLRPTAASNHILFVSNDQHRAYGEDFDVRTHGSNEDRNRLIVTHFEGNVYLIHSYTNPNHYLFVSNDQHRKFGDDFDVRTHANSTEERNRWIIEAANGNTFTIRSFTNPDHYLFAAHDGANAYGEDFDIRTHAHKEDRNRWHIDGFHLV